MRQDQIKLLQDLQDKLIDSVLIEADPDNWPGKDVLPMDMTKEERGDRYWCKKNAAATLTLINKIDSFGVKGVPDDGNTQEDDNLDKDIARHEKAASEQLKRFEQRKKMKVVK